MRHTDGETQNALFIQQRVDHTPRPEPALQLLRNAIDPALAAHILAHQHGLGMGEHEVVQRPVDQP